MSRALEIVKTSASIRLDLDADVLVFSYTNDQGDRWEGCIEEWIGNEAPTSNYEDRAVELNGVKYYQIATSGGGADVVLVRDHNEVGIYYLNNYDQTLSKVASSLRELFDALHPPE
jgi:hypothetical protein